MKQATDKSIQEKNTDREGNSHRGNSIENHSKSIDNKSESAEGGPLEDILDSIRSMINDHKFTQDHDNEDNKHLTDNHSDTNYDVDNDNFDDSHIETNTNGVYENIDYENGDYEGSDYEGSDYDGSDYDGNDYKKSDYKENDYEKSNYKEYENKDDTIRKDLEENSNSNTQNASKIDLYNKSNTNKNATDKTDRAEEDDDILELNHIITPLAENLSKTLNTKDLNIPIQNYQTPNLKAEKQTYNQDNNNSSTATTITKFSSANINKSIKGINNYSEPAISHKVDIKEAAESPNEINFNQKNHTYKTGNILSEQTKTRSAELLKEFANKTKTTPVEKTKYNERLISDDELNILIQKLIQPMLKDWLDKNLPQTVENIIREELKNLMPEK